MQNDEHKRMSLLSVFWGIFSFLFGFFLIYLIIKIFKNGRGCDENVISSDSRKENEEKSFLHNNGEACIGSFNLNERQSKILKLIMSKKEVCPSDIYKLEPDVSTRTLRRDMDVLVRAGVVRQYGNTKSTKYTHIG